MSQTIKTAGGNNAGINYDTKIPSLSDAANIVEAFKLYHFGLDNYDGSVAPATDSIEGHLDAFDSRIDILETTPSGGGIVTASVPFVLTRSDNTETSIPEGYIWVDEDGSVDSVTSAGVVTLNASEPSGPVHGMVWVDRDASVGVTVVTSDTITNMQNQINALNSASVTLAGQLNSASVILAARISDIEGLALLGL